jgi:hypothetical protein
MIKKIIVMISLVYSASLIGAEINSVASGVSISNDIWDFRLKEKVRCSECISGFMYTVEGLRKKDALKKLFSLDEVFSSVRAITTYNEKLIVVGTLPYGGDVFMIFDIESGKAVDVFYSYSSSISKSRRYVAYEKFYPRFSRGSDVDRKIYIYDFELSAFENRDEKINANDRENVGIEIEFENKKDQMVLFGDFLWLSEDKKIIFFAGNNLGRLRFFSLDLPVNNSSKKCARYIMQNYFKDGEGEVKYFVENMEYDDVSNDVLASFYAYKGISVSIVINIDEVCE